jgi:hypothetical protein
MRHLTIFLALVSLTMSGLAQPETVATDQGTITVLDATPQQAEDAEWALSRFEKAGLELPALTIVFHNEYQSCGMRQGVLQIRGTDFVIHECARDTAQSRRSLLHELAHTWDRFAQSINERMRTRFLELRGLESWNSADLPWGQRGEEQAAEIIAWGLMLRPAPIPGAVGTQGLQGTPSLADAFTSLTGMSPLFDPLTVLASTREIYLSGGRKNRE